jgi:hypothetical protein
MTQTLIPAPSGADRPEGALYFSPRGLYGFQVEHIAKAYLGVQSGEQPEWMFSWDTGLGKQAPLSEPVLTPAGWSRMGDLRVGDHVVSADGYPAEVLSIHPQTCREVYRITFSDGSWTRCGPDHLWTVGYWGSDRPSGKQKRVRRSKTVTLRQLMDEGIKTSAGRRKFSIPMTAPVQYPERELPMDPYVLGVVLGDGNVNHRGHLSLSTDKEIIETIAPDLPREDRNGCFVLRTNRWAESLRALGLAGHRSWEKFLPEEYLRASEAQRRAILAGLLDTDGSPIEDGGVEYCSTSERLVDAVVELVESLGGQARSKRSRVTTYTHNGEQRQGRESWRVNIKLNEQPFRLGRKAVCWVEPTKYPVQRMIESIERVEDEESMCITIDRPDGLYLTRSHIVTHNSHAAMQLSALAFEDGVADFVLLVCERNKLHEWRDDFEKFTRLEPRIHHGPSRKNKLTKLGLPEVLITTYETGKADLVRVSKTGRRKVLESADLLEMIAGRKPVVFFDEADRLSNRGSATYRAYEHALKALRKEFKNLPVFMMTATSVRRDLENSFNQFRLLRPQAMPLIGEFEKYFVRGRDIYGRAKYFDHRVDEFVELCRPLMLAKRKTDPDVIDQFPRMTEEALRVDLEGEQKKLYDLVAEMDGVPGQLQALRQICAHPRAILHSAMEGSSKLARALVEEFGADYLMNCPSAKTEALVAYLEPIVLDQEDKAVCFSFFGPSALPWLADALTKAGMRVFFLHELDAFKSHQGGAVLLTSDAGARGINIPEASYLVEYDVAVTYGLRTQRLNRISRIGSGGPSVTVRSMIANETVEVPLVYAMLKGNAQSDALLGPGEDGAKFLTSAMRREMLLGEQ